MHGHFQYTRTIHNWVHSFIEPDLFDNNVPFDNTTPTYLISLLWKLGLGLRLDLQLHYFSIFHNENETSTTNCLIYLGTPRIFNFILLLII